jgi:hypothetical protein
MRSIRKLVPGNVTLAFTEGSLVPASPAVKAAAEDKNRYENNDDKRGVAHAELL